MQNLSQRWQFFFNKMGFVKFYSHRLNNLKKYLTNFDLPIYNNKTFKNVS